MTSICSESLRKLNLQLIHYYNLASRSVIKGFTLAAKHPYITLSALGAAIAITIHACQNKGIPFGLNIDKFLPDECEKLAKLEEELNLANQDLKSALERKQLIDGKVHFSDRVIEKLNATLNSLLSTRIQNEEFQKRASKSSQEYENALEIHRRIKTLFVYASEVAKDSKNLAEKAQAMVDRIKSRCSSNS